MVAFDPGNELDLMMGPSRAQPGTAAVRLCVEHGVEMQSPGKKLGGTTARDGGGLHCNTAGTWQLWEASATATENKTIMAI